MKRGVKRAAGILCAVLLVLWTMSGVLAAENRVSLGSGRYYDRSSALFIYTLSQSGAEVTATVGDGMIVAEPVQITVPVGVDAVLYRDGKEVEDADFSRIAEPGSYVLSVVSNSETSEQPFSFRIVSSVTGAVECYRMPDGCRVTSVLLNGQAIEFSTSQVELTEEGEYHIEYLCLSTGAAYQLDITADFTAPTLALEGVRNGVTHSTVDLSDAEPGAVLTVLRDGEPVAAGTELSETGDYTVTITDEAGNSTDYQFSIQPGLNLSGFGLLLLLLAAAAALALYALRERNRTRVR